VSLLRCGIMKHMCVPRRVFKKVLLKYINREMVRDMEQRKTYYYIAWVYVNNKIKT
jgi:hypothetical protein